MDSQPDIPIGERIRFHRQARRKTQAVVAGLAGVTEDYLSQIERGLKSPTVSGTAGHMADELVAIWDGQPGKDQGGTGAVVEQARQLGKLVHVIWPEGTARG